VAFCAGGGGWLHRLYHPVSVRQVYLVSYDIANPKRLRHIAKIMEGYGHRLQYSVFESHLTELKLEELKAEVKDVLNHEDDQVLFVALGPDSSRSNIRIDALGRPYVVNTNVTII